MTNGLNGHVEGLKTVDAEGVVRRGFQAFDLEVTTPFLDIHLNGFEELEDDGFRLTLFCSYLKHSLSYDGSTHCFRLANQLCDIELAWSHRADSNRGPAHYETTKGVSWRDLCRAHRSLSRAARQGEEKVLGLR